MAKSDIDWLDKKTEQFTEGGIKIVENDNEADEVHWAQNPEKIYRDLEAQEPKKIGNFPK